jgi:predicted  nucleic acid-binding Zn-ribbon protein
MTVTEKLLRVFLVDKQLRGLQSRLGGAEKFLKEQEGHLGGLDTKRQALESQFKTLQAKAKDHEGEIARLEARIATLREQMNNAKTSKEFQAFNLEIKNLETDRDKITTVAVEHMTQVDAIKKQVDELTGQRSEREKVRQVAAEDRSKRASEIHDRLTELKAERQKVASDVPADALTTLEKLIVQRGENAMATVEVQDAKRHEFNCGACMMNIPVDAAVSLLTTGRLTKCASCGCILYMDEEARKMMVPPTKRGKKTVQQD